MPQTPRTTEFIVAVVTGRPRHPWAFSFTPRHARAGSAEASRTPGVADAQSTRPVVRRARHSAELAMAIVRALATATVAEVALAYDRTIGQVASIASHAEGVTRRPRGAASAPVVVEDVPRTAPTGRLPTEPVASATAVHGTGVRLADVGSRACCALDDVGDCCARPTWGSSSWCADHARAYLRCREVA